MICEISHQIAFQIIQTNRFRQDLQQYNLHVAIPLITPTSDTITLQRYALQGLRAIFRSGYLYKKAGVILSEIAPASHYQADLFGTRRERPALMQAMDQINTRFGKGTLRLSQDGSRHSWVMRKEKKSPEYTTNWNELPVCR